MNSRALNQRRIFLRGDGNSKIGLGHIMRLITVSSYFKATFSLRFALVDSDLFVEGVLDSAKLDWTTYKNENDFISILGHGDIVFIDGYSFDSAYFSKIKSRDCIVIFIDDENTQDLQLCDVVINHTPGYNLDDFKVSKTTKLFLGHEYCMIRKAFLDNQIVRRITKIGHIVLSLGMSNSGKILNEMLKHTLHVWPEAKVTVLPGCNIISVPESNRVHLKYDLSEKQIIKLFDSTDLAILPVSTIYMEALARNTIVGAGYFIDNQKAVYEQIEGRGLIFELGDLQLLNEAKLTKFKKEINLSLPTKNSNTHFGRGWGEIVKTVNSFKYAND